MVTRKQYSKEFKLDAVSLVKEQDYNRSEAAKSLGINSGMLGRWVKESSSDNGQDFRGLSGFLKGIKVLIGHRFFLTVGVEKTSIARGIRTYDHQQVYRKAA